VDTKTRHALKHNALADTAQSGFDWLQENKGDVIRFVLIVVAVLALGIGGAVAYQHQQEQAQAAFGAAMEDYLTPLAQSATQEQPGMKTYPTAAARAKAANAEFLKVADSNGWTEAGRNAEYFAGITYMEMGQTADAERTLQQVADHGNHNLAALAQMALASIAQQAGRTSDAIQIYQRLAAHPTSTVPASQAKLALAALYEQTNPQQAKQLYAEIKDADKDTAAGQIATQKLAQLH
jgi:tetratricopeptide (TPR) repeat protein